MVDTLKIAITSLEELIDRWEVIRELKLYALFVESSLGINK